jgi:hypothetical protein
VGRVGGMELTFSCANCGAVGHVSPLETTSQAECRQCGITRPLHSEAIVDSQLQSCPWCLTTDLYVQKDFPQGLGLFIVVVGFAISTVFWYYEMPISAYMVLVASMALDLVMYYTVPEVTICYRCLCQLRGVGVNDTGRFKPFDLSIGERYRQERLRVEQLRERGASAE